MVPGMSRCRACKVNQQLLSRNQGFTSSIRSLDHPMWAFKTLKNLIKIEILQKKGSRPSNYYLNTDLLGLVIDVMVEPYWYAYHPSADSSKVDWQISNRIRASLTRSLISHIEPFPFFTDREVPRRIPEALTYFCDRKPIPDDLNSQWMRIAALFNPQQPMTYHKLSQQF